MNKAILGNTVLVTGAGGSIGSALTKTIVGYAPQLLVLLDRSEHNLYQIETDLAMGRVTVPNASVLGDICNEELVSETLERYRPNTIYHVAAFKHVPLMERNPIAAIQNNALGTNVLARAARKHRVKTMTMVSTDKAVSPRSMMGASKRLAELALVRWTCEEKSDDFDPSWKRLRHRRQCCQTLRPTDSSRWPGYSDAHGGYKVLLEAP